MNGVDVKISTLDAAARKCTSPGTLGVKVNVAKPSASLTLLTLPTVPTLPAELAAEPRADLRGSEAYKRNLVRVFTIRGLKRASERARGGG